MSAEHSESGRLRAFLGEYQLVRPIARGGMGSVFEVKSRRTGASYAAKTILRAGDERARERFRREAELLARVDKHKGIVKVHAFGETPDGSLYMILDLVSGESLEALLEREHKLEPRRAALLARDMADALAAVHDLGVVHRDVKPSNILFDHAGVPKLTDFGLATALDLDRLTRSGTFVGTLSYCAPEQATGSAEPSGPRTDVFALGAVLFHCLSGKLPIEAESPVELLAKLSSPHPIRDVRLVAPEVPAPLAAIVSRCLRKKARDRYPDARALALDLESFLAGRPTSSSVALEPPPRLSHVTKGVVLGVIAVAAVSVAVFVTGKEGRQGRAALDAAAELVAKAKSAIGPRASDLELQQALEAAQQARDRASEAEALKTPEAGTARDAALTAIADAASLLAERKLEKGDAREALALLDQPGAQAVLSPDARFVRARALLALKRFDDAAAGAHELAASGPAAKRAEAAELEGDALFAKESYAAAEAAYAKALARPDGRAKRAAAAAGAHDDKTALADLAAIVVDPDKLSTDRAQNAKLAGIAPAVYRHALELTGAASDREFETAWRLANPPPELFRPVIDRWLETSFGECEEWTHAFLGSMKADEEHAKGLRLAVRRIARSRRLEPRCNIDRAWNAFESIRHWMRNTDMAIVARVGQIYEAEWPEGPLGTYMVAYGLRRTSNEEERTFVRAKARTLAATFDPPRPEEPLEVRRIAACIAIAIIEMDETAHVTPDDDDLDTVKKLAIRSNYADGWFAVIRCLRAMKRYDDAFAAIEPLTGMLGFGDEPVGLDRIVYERCEVLFAAGRTDEALAYARKMRAEVAWMATRVESSILLRAKRWEELANSVPPESCNDDVTLVYMGVAFARTGRRAELAAILARFDRRGAEGEGPASDLRARVKAAEKGE